MVNYNKVKVAVIGVGHLGQHHARIISQLPTTELIAVVDTNISRGTQIAEKYKTHVFSDYKEILNRVEAVTIAAPTTEHYSIAKDCLDNGLHCFVEKPITTKIEHAEELLELSRQKGLTLQIGHVERFNPAVVEAKKYINNPKFIDAQRLGPYDPRMSYIGVVLDLMIHDIDIILSLANSPVTDLDAIGAKVLSQYEDIANARIKFASGCVANISASRISYEKHRKIRVFQPDSYISLDYGDKVLKIIRKKVPTISSLKDIEITIPELPKYEPLSSELEHYIDCIIKGTEPIVSAKHGRDALELALEILQNISY